MGAITLTPREQTRLQVLNALQQGRCTPEEAIHLLGLSERHLRRLRAAYQIRGAAALAHGNRGRPSPRRIPAQRRDRLVRLARTKYAGVNFQHLTELLAEQDHLLLSRPTVHRILTRAGIVSPRTRRPPAHRTRRERMPQEGMLAQFDGSHHPWLEDRGPKLVLHAGADDATGKILGASFDEEETAAGYFHVFRQTAQGCGLPRAAYTDRHGIFARSPRQPLTLEEQLQGHRAPTQLGRMFQELGIQWIPASSPQAKGRIERLFGALQDRLVAELRMADIRTKEAANAFLPDFITRYNARFAKPAAHPDAAYQPWPAGRDPETIFCFKYLRTVANDHTVTFPRTLVQIVPNGRSYAHARVELHERLDGTLHVYYQGHPLTTKPLTPLPAARVSARHDQRLNPHQLQSSPRRREKPRTERSASRVAHSSRPRADPPWRQYDQVQKLKAARRLRRRLRTKSLNA